jgi:predicted nucleic acid-binding protein
LIPILIDSVYVIALVNRRDKYHVQAQQLARQLAGRPLLITDSILLEVGNALARHFRQEAVTIIEQFLNSSEVEIVYTTPKLFAAAFARYKQYTDKEWGLVDCISFEIMETRGIQQALTPDQHFVQAGFTVLMKTDG